MLGQTLLTSMLWALAEAFKNGSPFAKEASTPLFFFFFLFLLKEASRTSEFCYYK